LGQILNRGTFHGRNFSLGKGGFLGNNFHGGGFPSRFEKRSQINPPTSEGLINPKVNYVVKRSDL